MEVIPTAELVNDSPRPTSSKLLAVITISVLALGLCVVLVTRGRFRAMLDEMEIHQPLLTQLALGPTVSVCLIVLLVPTVIKEFVPACQSVGDRWNAVTLVLGLGLGGIYAIGLIMPLLSIVQALS